MTKRLGFLLLPSVVVLGVIGIVFWTAPTLAGLPNSMTNADYSGQPPFIASVVKPNVLIMLDNSASMGYRAVCDNTANDWLGINSVTKGGAGGRTATVLYGAPHGFSVGQSVTVSIVSPSVPLDAPFNGTFAIASVPTPNSFTYTMSSAPYSSFGRGHPQVKNNTLNKPGAGVFKNCPTSASIYPVGSPAGAPFLQTVTFTGMFDSLSCYTYDATAGNTRFDVTSTKAAIDSPCGSAEWDGNFLNWATFRRQDALKKAFVGGVCAVARAADGSCPTSGSPAKITLKGAEKILDDCCENDSTYDTPICTASCPANTAYRRVPDALQTRVTAMQPSATGLVLHLMATTAMTSGGFCVGGNKVAAPSTTATACGVTGAPTPGTNGEYLIRASVATEPLGVIQDIGDQARFGLMEFQSSSEGGILDVPIGSTVFKPYTGSALTNYSSNKAAMIAAIEQTISVTGTPLAETLYAGIRYMAQLPQPFGLTGYAYPCAFSTCGPSFPSSSSTAGSIGPITAPSSASEPSQLASGTPSDSCPSPSAGLGYINGACGRDPYLFGTNPAWSSQGNPKQVPCCKTFIMLMTDGEALADDNAQLDRFLYPSATATAIHGVTCTGTYAAITEA